MSVERVALRQQRDLGQIVEAAFSLYRQNFWRFFSIAAVLIPFGILTSILALEFSPTFDDVLFETPIVDQEAYDEAVEDALRDGFIFAAVLLPLVLLQAVAQWLASLAIMAAVADLDAERAPELSHAMRQRPPDFSRAYGVVLTRFWTLVGASLRAGFHIFLFAITIIGIPWAIQRMVRWLFIHQAVILDGTSARAALSYSADAVQGRWWRTLGIAIVIAIIGGVPASIIGALVGFAPLLISSTASAVVTAAILPFGVIAMTLLYLDLKARRENDVSP
jgi:hypothetical protein